MDGGESSRRGRARNRIGSATLLAALIHLQMVALVGVVAYFAAPRNADLARLSPAEPIDITALGEEESREIAAELDKQERQEEEERKKQEEKPAAPGQVVDIPTPRDQRPPREARFAAEQDSSVQRETRRNGPPEKPRASAAPAETSPLLAMRPPSPRQAPGRPSVPGAPPTLGGQSPETETAPPPGIEGQPGNPAPPAPEHPISLVPTNETLARAMGGGTPDYLRDVEEGAETALNAKKWKFASFFNRVKEQIRQHWHAAQEYQRRDPTGSVYGSRAHYTLLRVQLRRDGSLASVHVQQGSGVDFLDDVAMEAVKQAQPFPNPPQQLIDQALGLISFQFGFVVDVSGQPRLKLFRYSSM